MEDIKLPSSCARAVIECTQTLCSETCKGRKPSPTKLCKYQTRGKIYLCHNPIEMVQALNRRIKEVTGE